MIYGHEFNFKFELVLNSARRTCDIKKRFTIYIRLYIYVYQYVCASSGQI